MRNPGLCFKRCVVDPQGALSLKVVGRPDPQPWCLPVQPGQHRVYKNVTSNVTSDKRSEGTSGVIPITTDTVLSIYRSSPSLFLMSGVVLYLSLAWGSFLTSPSYLVLLGDFLLIWSFPLEGWGSFLSVPVHHGMEEWSNLTGNSIYSHSSSWELKLAMSGANPGPVLHLYTASVKVTASFSSSSGHTIRKHLLAASPKNSILTTSRKNKKPMKIEARKMLSRHLEFRVTYRV